MVKKISKRIYVSLILLFLYAPIFTLIVLSFNESRSMAVWKGFSLQWYVDSYKGPDNLLRAAAKYLLDQALAPAC